MSKTALITGSAGLIGSESARFFAGKGYHIVGVDNDMRSYFFGPEASTTWNRERLAKGLGGQYTHYHVDIRDTEALEKIFQNHSFNIVIHTAAQPSHDWAAKEPLTDFSVNALGTLILLDLTRRYAPTATFIFTSTNKVYGDAPNRIPLVEKETRFEVEPGHRYEKGIDESMSIDQNLHSVFGASKVAADIMVQEYGRYFGLNTAVFRGGCLTGPGHSGTQLHGFLAYLIKCVATDKPYYIFGYKGKQVRDNIHASDLVNMFWNFHQKPRPGEVYNAGGGLASNVSLIEALAKAEKLLNKKAKYEYKQENRIGDHIWYVTDYSKFQSHYPEWKIMHDIDMVMKDIAEHGHF